MIEKHSIIAFLATLAAIVILVLTGAWMALQGRNSEALGIGGAVTGLIGVIGTFRPRSATTDAQDSALKTAIDKIPPETGDAKP